MDKSIQKNETAGTGRKNKKYHPGAIEALVRKYGVTKEFIRWAIRGHRTSDLAETIARDYKALTRPAERKIQEFLSDQQ